MVINGGRSWVFETEMVFEDKRVELQMELFDEENFLKKMEKKIYFN